jgi:phenylacetate-CoA ligase
MGELVFTSLTKEAFPIIRYRTRDLTRLLPGTARSMRRMEKVTGRSDDMIILRGVNVFPTQIEEQLMATDGLGPAFPDRTDARGADGRHDRACGGRRGAHGLRRAEGQSAEALKARIKERVGITVEIAAHGSGGVPRSQGKAVRIVDNRPRLTPCRGARPRSRRKTRRAPPGGGGAFRRAGL